MKAIRKDDFLIYTRGMPKGYSAAKFMSGSNDKLAASHHFIYLRPRLSLLDIDVPYLHLMLELFVRHQLGKMYNDKLAEQGSTQTSMNSITIKELKRQRIVLLRDRDAQKLVVSEYAARKKEVQAAINNLELTESMILSNAYLENKVD